MKKREDKETNHNTEQRDSDLSDVLEGRPALCAARLVAQDLLLVRVVQLNPPTRENSN
jgi:hypothetical protein